VKPITRRSALALGGIGAALIAAGGVGLLTGTPGDGAPGSTPDAGAALRQPKLLRSRNGALSLDLRVEQLPVLIGHTSVQAMTYGGTLPGPTLVVHPGDILSIKLDNRLSTPTNLHTHGLHVSPEGHSDDVLRRIDAGTSGQYQYAIPSDHPPGVFWYHPHHHGMAADQVFGGLYGAIIVDDSVPIEVAHERILIISDMTFDAAGQIASPSPMDKMNGREGSTLLLNGQVGATLAAHPGDRERWRIVNACTSRYLDLRLDGQRLQLLGNDSGRLAEPQSVQQLLLAPGNRADVLVTMTQGTTSLRTVAVDRGSSGGMGSASASSPSGIATLTVAGLASGPAPAVATQAVPRDLRAVNADASRTLTLAMTMGGMGGMGGSGRGAFTIDGRSFDPSRIDQHVRAGAVEEWTIVNTSPMDHPFHLHVWPMQLLRVGSDTVGPAVWQDVVNIPAHSSSTVRIAFNDFTGTSVFHCHILDHEDQGMMGVIRVA
jgi:FtsP/CotA-like multicopper oxidase with cupredoxin domain